VLFSTAAGKPDVSFFAGKFVRQESCGKQTLYRDMELLRSYTLLKAVERTAHATNMNTRVFWAQNKIQHNAYFEP
jgi:hypothetical protein